MLHDGFLPLVEQCWSTSPNIQDQAKILTAKFKSLRATLRSWQKQLSNLKALISSVKLVLSFLELLEEWRDLTIMEWNF